MTFWPNLVHLLLLNLLLIEVHTQKYASQEGIPSQSSTFIFRNKPLTANLAIEGGPTNDFFSESCATTEDTGWYSAWWMLQFTRSIYVTNIKIFYRDITPYRLAGYYLYITNTSVTNGDPKPPDSDLCYHDEGPNLPDINQSVTCNGLGRNVVIYNDRNRTSSNNKPDYSEFAVFELCDVQVFGCNKSQYGMSCEFSCSSKCYGQHCFPGNGSCIWGCNCLGDNCDNASICTEGCKGGFGGKQCTENNLATDGKPSLSSKGNNIDPKLAIDGDRTADSCSQIKNRISSWLLDLNRPSVIRNIYIYISDAFLEENRPLLYVSNTSEISSADIRLNFTISDETPRLPILNITLDTFVIAQFVRYHPEDSNVDLCEVEVIGCASGFYGKNCNMICPENCQGQCDLDTGVCMYGCLAGWINPYCNQSCTDGKFGFNCAETCHCYTTTPSCNKENGSCPTGGCVLGYKGDSCSTECLNGTYGYNCNETCDGCLYNFCDKKTGICTDQSGCKPGWKPNQLDCKEACDDDYYGNCSRQCHCRSGICNKTSGQCRDNQCARGWMGLTCSEECRSGSFGYNCMEKCTSCMNISCEVFEGNCTDGCIQGYAGVKCQRLLVQEKESSASPAVYGIITALLVVIGVIILVFILRYRRRHNTSGETKSEEVKKSIPAKSYTERTKYDEANTHDNIPLTSNITVNNIGNDSTGKAYDTREINNPAFNVEEETEVLYSNVDTIDTQKKYKIPVEEIDEIITNMKTDDVFEEQFKILPKGLIQPHKEASKPENKVKNRYAETWPYDHSRVVLEGKNNYINASYIDSYTRNKAYIATQGPKKGTIDDFWQMVWQESVEIVVMVTQLVEGDKKKCDRYWPESKDNVMAVKQYNLNLIEEKRQTVNMFRKIEITNTKSKSKRMIYHYHFTEWPDHGVPDKINLVSFYRKVKKTSTLLNGPMVVHCSAGIGRTGTFIAIDALHKQGLETGYIDVMEYVQIMRKDRLNMIQTKEQYTAVFEALAEIFTVPDFSIDKDNFEEYVQQQSKLSEKERRILQEYAKLQQLKPKYQSSDFKAANLKENINKNIVKDILPHDRYRPFLMSYEKSRNDYINAVLIPEYNTMTNFYATQYPLEDTVVDFWTMVYDHDCTAVVFLEQFQPETRIFPDEKGSLEFQNFCVSHLSRDLSNSIHINITPNETTKTSKEVNVFILNEWKSNCIPESNKELLDLINNLSNWRVHHPGSVAVVCRDGCTRSGLFVAIELAQKKLDMDEEIDIFQVVRTMQIRRPQFIFNFDQYNNCYQSIEEHLSADSLYANV